MPKSTTKKINENEVKDYLNLLCFRDLSSYDGILNWNTEIIVKIFREKKIQYTMEKIIFWDNFQNSKLSFDDDFKALIFKGANPSDQYIILTNLFDKYAVDILFEDFDQMADHIFEMDFFQPNDYLFINVSKESIVGLHHSGYIVKSQCMGKILPGVYFT